MLKVAVYSLIIEIMSTTDRNRLHIPTERSKEAAKGLARILRASDLVEPDMEYMPEIRFRPNFDDKYSHLAEEMFIDFSRRAKAMNDDGLTKLASKQTVLHGMRIMTRMMRYGPSSYAAYKDRAGDLRTATVDELSSVVRASRDEMVNPIGHLDSQSAFVMETDIGLIGFGQTWTPPYVLADTEAGLRMQPSGVLMREATIDIIREKINTENPYLTGRCPALGIVLKHFWGQAVDSCAAQPDLFPMDLADEVTRLTAGRL